MTLKNLTTLALGFFLSIHTPIMNAQSPYPKVKLSDVPEPLVHLYRKEEPNFTDQSHCAAAWDSTTDGEKMAFKCSVFIKMSAEGERRAMNYCEEIRKEKKISAACRLIVNR